MSNISLYHDILSSTLKTNVDYQWPDLCQNLPQRYEAESNFQYFNVCTIYPELIQGLSNGAFDSNRTFIDELSNYRILPLQNVPAISQGIVAQTVDFLVRTCEGINCNNDLSALFNMGCDWARLRSANGQSLIRQEVEGCKTALCVNLQLYVRDDPDIGGVGVFISYILQILLVLFMTIYVLFKFILHERRVVPSDMHSPFTGSIAFPESLKEFQKLQSWFIGSLVVAAFIRQLQEFNSISITDYLFLGGISLNGVVLICYMNAALLLLGRKSWYVYILSCVTFLLCSAFLLYANYNRKTRVDDILPALSFCQKELSSLPYAEQITDWVRLVARLPRSIVYVAWAFCLIVQMSCIFWMLEGEKRVSRGFRSWVATRGGQVVLWLFIVIIMLCFLAIFALQLTMLYNFWGIVDPQQWSFGQIIAVTIWLPLIIDYIHGRFKEKQGYLANQRNSKDDEAGYSILDPPLPPPPGTSGSGKPPSTQPGTVTTMGGADASTVFSHPQHQSVSGLSDYSYPPPHIRIDTHGGPPTISPTILTQSHFGSPLLPSIPSSPLFPTGSGLPAPGSTPPSMASVWNRGGVPHDGRTFAPTPLHQQHQLGGDESVRQSGTSQFTNQTGSSQYTQNSGSGTFGV